MVNNENIIPKTETVYELKNKVPSFEEFMQSYENDDNLNYDDLNGGSIGEAKGYGSCSYSSYKINGRHIDVCGNSDCSYYRQICANNLIINADNATKESFGIGLSTGATIGL